MSATTTERPWHLLPPTFSEIEEAAQRIKSRLRTTPVLENDRLNELLGGRVLLKAEGLQVTGSFKARGVWNRLASLSQEEAARGIVCFSSGNHGHAVAWAAHVIGSKAVVVMPDDAPEVKTENVRAWGAEIVTYDRHRQDRKAVARELVEARKLTFVPPYEDRRIIAGAATLGREALQQAEELGADPDAIIVSCGGGGLAAGTCLSWKAMRGMRGGSECWIVEPAGYDDTARSLESGYRETNTSGRTTICDALLAPTPGDLTFSINSQHVSGAIVVSDEEVKTAMLAAMRLFGIVAEPGGALPLAAVLSRKFDVRDRQVLLVVSGSNADPAVLGNALETASDDPLWQCISR